MYTCTLAIDELAVTLFWYSEERTGRAFNFILFDVAL